MIDQVPTICPYCSTGCSVNLISHNGKITGTTPNFRSPVNEGKLCPKGTYCHQFIHSPDRLKKPLIRKGGVFIETDWESAYQLIARELKKFSPDEIGVLASARCTNEDNYTLMKFARGALKTRHLDHCARLCHASTITGLTLSFGNGAMTNSIADIGESDCIVCLGSNTFEQHPMIGRQIIRAKSRGARFICADPRFTPTAVQADLFLQFYSGSDVAILNCIMGEIVRHGWEDKEFIADRTREYESFRKVVLQKHYEPRAVALLTGVTVRDLEQAAEWIGTAKSCNILYAMGISQNVGAVNNVRAVANLMMLTGNIGRPGTGVNALRGQVNSQGACDMGCLPDFFPGYQPITDGHVHRRVNHVWQFPDGICSPMPGYEISLMFQSAREKKQNIKAMVLVGENPVVSEPDLKSALEAIKNLQFLVVSDIFFTETCQYADVVLPAACFAEKDGTMTNTERRVQRIRKVTEPPGEAKPDWQIIAEIAAAMGYSDQFNFCSAEDIFREMQQINPLYEGMEYEWVSSPDGAFWPCKAGDHFGTPILHTDRFSHPDGKGVFCPVEWKAPSEVPDSRYPYRFTTGRIIWHWQTGTMTRRSKNLTDEVNEAYIEVHPLDAETLGVSDGEMVRITSKKGSLTSRVRVVPDIKQGVMFMPLHFVEAAVNELTHVTLGAEAGIFDYKTICVRVEPVGSGAEP